MLELNILDKQIPVSKLLEVLKYKEDDIVFAAGSLIEGIGNRHSDLDIFILTESLERFNEIECEYDFDQFKVTFTNAYGIGFDIEVWSKELLLEVISKINLIQFDTSTRTYNLLDLPNNNRIEDIMSLVHRFITGTALYNQDGFNSLLEKLNLDNYYRLMVRMSMNEVDNTIDDLIGNVDKKDFTNAVLVGRTVLVETLTTYLFSMKMSLDRPKWVYPKLRQLAETDDVAKKFMKKFDEITFVSLSNEKEFEKNAHKILDFTNLVLSKIEL
ncbi:hypothetical protein [Alkaliphilus hydrothermalis]|uniref:Nucleotidyltransferase domain-containing protein n=1 Tax=Alkaliphilus hydrothermalis TaxID=1482730 RepID=A0ABS2NTA4_9FIRM|nr:hypothetical protein [Alkaliphilus hydrothermalis]MBM7616199.1 hypothetical protein [Alkaliphilus hydrothermalis]